MPRLLSLRIGKIQAFGPADQPSAIVKQAVSGRVELSKLGLEGDKQADAQHHGGIDKALHHYPFEHYAAWTAELPKEAGLFQAGGFGENLSTLGMDENSVCLGDIFHIGSARIQVSQGRKPCWKLNHRFGIPDMARRVQDSGRTGWYYRVLDEGGIAPDDELTLIERPHPNWPLARLISVIYHDKPDRKALAELAMLEFLAPSWREMAEKRLSSGKVEDWLRRLVTPIT
jgi:MOSC domain-containing protein YiiM